MQALASLLLVESVRNVNRPHRLLAAAKATLQKPVESLDECPRHTRYKVYVSLTSADGTVEYQPPPGYLYGPGLNALVSDTSRDVGVVVVEELVAPTGETVALRSILAIPDSVVQQLGALASILRKMDGSDLALRLERAESLVKDLDRNGIYDETYLNTSDDGYLHVGRLQRDVHCEGFLVANKVDLRMFDPEFPGATADAAEYFGEMVRMVEERNAGKDAERETQFGDSEPGRQARVDAQHRRVVAGRGLERALREAAAQFGVHPAIECRRSRRSLRCSAPW
jgi:hypothetical protein